MICPKCQSVIPNDCNFCTQCGFRLDTEITNNPKSGETVSDSEINAVENARLHRSWGRAVHLATELLHARPDDPRVHVLLGDIYADQNQWEKAKQWYELALDIDSSYEGLTQKFTHAEQMLEKSEDEAIIESLRTKHKPEGLTRETWIRVGVVALSLILVIFVVSLLFKKTKTQVPLAAFGQLNQEATPNDGSNPPNISSSNPPSPTPTEPAPRPVEFTQTAAENTLIAHVQEALKTSDWSTAKLLDLQMNLRDQDVQVTLYVPSVYGSSFAEVALRTSFLAGETALGVSGYKNATVRVLSEYPINKSNSREIYMMADLTGPVQDPSVAARGDLSVIGKSMRNIWWNRTILSR